MSLPPNNANVSSDSLLRRLVSVAAVRALLAQLIAAAIALAWLQWGSSIVQHQPALLHGCAAAVIGVVLRLPLWWLPINALFVPAAVWLQGLHISSIWFLAVFIVFVALYWTTYRTRVPLFLSNAAACDRLASLLPADSRVRLIDLGCGFGGVLKRLHRLRPATAIVGRELAPLPAWIAWLRLRRIPRADIARQDFWHEDLSEYDLVFAFLSPEPMLRLWRKVCAEMRPGSLFVSHAFAVPGVAPDLTLPVPGSRRAPLYVWRL